MTPSRPSDKTDERWRFPRAGGLSPEIVSELQRGRLFGAVNASAAAPVATIDPASEIGVTSALAKGKVNPEGKETSYHFEYISDAAFGVHQDAEQKLTIAASAGTYTLSFQGESTKAIAFEASAATIEEALNALSTISGVGGSVSVSGGPGDESGSSPYAIAAGRQEGPDRQQPQPLQRHRQGQHRLRWPQRQGERLQASDASAVREGPLGRR